ncbi:hypothetical protein BFW97_12505 [Aeromonas hydrophila]|nr:hypothetical protein BFW97_12505 [Aeromonas hydrophila]
MNDTNSVFLTQKDWSYRDNQTNFLLCMTDALGHGYCTIRSMVIARPLRGLLVSEANRNFRSLLKQSAQLENSVEMIPL